MIIFLVSAVAISSCVDTTDEPITAKSLAEAYSEIQAISESEPCDNPSDWKWTPIGHKSCGGPTEYIPYSTNIDVDAFLILVEEYTAAQTKYNTDNGIVSDCSITSQPKGIVCEDNNPVFTY